MKLISIIFSFRNEEDNLEELVTRTSNVIKNINNWNYELIFVNDNSDDRSESILEKLQEKHSIKIINMSRTFGVGPCVLAGFKHSEGDCVIYMDSDLQDPPELIENLIHEYEKGSEVVHSIRTERQGESKFKLFITKVAYKVINYMADIDLPIEAGDFKLISKKALKKILEQKEFNPYIRGLSIWVGFKQSKVEYTRLPRKAGKTHFSLFSKGPIPEFIRGVTSYSIKPLYLGLLLGMMGFLFSIILIIYTLYLKFNGMSVPGSASVIITISFFSGIILFVLGILGVYLGKIYEQTKGRDPYVIKDIKTKN